MHTCFLFSCISIHLPQSICPLQHVKVTASGNIWGTLYLGAKELYFVSSLEVNDGHREDSAAVSTSTGNSNSNSNSNNGSNGSSGEGSSSGSGGGGGGNSGGAVVSSQQFKMRRRRWAVRHRQIQTYLYTHIYIYIYIHTHIHLHTCVFFRVCFYFPHFFFSVDKFIFVD